MNVAMLLIHSARGDIRNIMGEIFMLCVYWSIVLFRWFTSYVWESVDRNMFGRKVEWSKNSKWIVKSFVYVCALCILIILFTLLFLCQKQAYTLDLILSVNLRSDHLFGLCLCGRGSFGPFFSLFCIWIWPQEIRGNNHKANWYLHTVKLCL